MVKVKVRGEQYYMNPFLKAKWDLIRRGGLKKVDEDRVYIVDGREGSGKSVFALQQAGYIDPTLVNNIHRVTFSAQETLDAIRRTKSTNKKTKAIVFDEAFRGLSSKAALSKVNKQIIQALMEMRQNNLVLFLVSPSFFLLELYSATLRSHALFHIVKSHKSRRRFFRAFSHRKKAILYQKGIRKGWSYNMSTKHRDKFSNRYPGGNDFRDKYLKKKEESFRNASNDGEKMVIGDGYKLKFGVLSNLLKKRYKVTYKDQEKMLSYFEEPLSDRTISRIVEKLPLKPLE